MDRSALCCAAEPANADALVSCAIRSSLLGFLQHPFEAEDGGVLCRWCGRPYLVIEMVLRAKSEDITLSSTNVMVYPTSFYESGYKRR